MAARGGPNLTTHIEVITRGPLFDGSFAKEMRRCTEEIEQEIGDDAAELVQERLDQVLRNPTGFYRSHIRAHPVGEVVTVDDSGVIYGPWLEGVSRRNEKSRFKGYATFRKVWQEMDRRVPELAQRIVGRYVS